MPLGTPLLAGPGAIVATMLFSRQVDDRRPPSRPSRWAWSSCTPCIWLAMRFSVPILRVIKDERRACWSPGSPGLLLSAIAVQMVADAVRAFIAGQG